MTTLAVMKADIADDLARSDLSTSIGDAITRAIAYYQNKRFYFNESRDLTFATVASQSRYATADDADIPKFITLDGVFITVSGQNRQLSPISVQEFELWNDNSAATGQPTDYCYFNMGFGLFPVPDNIYTIRPIGHVMKDAPASDGEANNVWMTEGYQLIRYRAEADVALNKARDRDRAQELAFMVDNELTRLLAETSKRKATGKIRPTSF